MFGYLDDFAILNRKSGIMTGRAADAYPNDEGFAYISQDYERTPFGRLTESGLPGKAYAIDPNVPAAQRQTVRISYDPIKIPGLDLQKDRYHFMTTTGMDGRRSVSVLNSQKQQVAAAALGSNKAIISATTTAYEKTTKIETDFLPAYFENKKTMIRTGRFDFLGNLVQQTDPNMEGKIQHCYNDINQLRFSQSPAIAKEGKFAYKKYDSFRRITEEGYCYDTWQDAVKHADNPEYPSSNHTRLRSYEYGKDIADIGAMAALISTKKEDSAAGVREEYGYDSFGREISKSVSVGEKKFTQSWKLNNQGDVVSMKNADGTVLNYVFDYCGRPAYENLDTERLTTFSYHANDMIHKVETPGGTTEYNYTNTGWIKEIKSPLMEESISYKGMKIEEFLVKLKVSAPNVPAAIRYALEYDEFGRLYSANCYDGDKLMEEISIKSISYDANGNILKMEAGGKLREYLYKENTDRLSGVDKEDDFTYNSDGAVTSYKSRGIEEIVYENDRPVSFKFKTS